MTRPPKIAIYEPSPRICGPDSWAQYMRAGFRAVGAECHLVTLTKGGKSRVKWGRVERESGLVASCTLVPDRVGKNEFAGEFFDEYDLIVLTDVKTPDHDKIARNEYEPWPQYVENLLQTSTPWTSALHGRLYFEPHEGPQGQDEMRGSPYLAELMTLKNFAGFLLDHCVDERFVTWSARLRETLRIHMPLPYVLSCDDDEITRDHDDTVCAIGRVTQIKYRHLLNELAWRDGWPLDHCTIFYGGAASTTYGPCESYELYEQLVGSEKSLNPRPWTGRREKGVRSNTVWEARNERTRSRVEYLGAYDHPKEVCLRASIHVGITDSLFSGGLCEFSTMEAIDAGCFPIVSRPFEVPQLDLESTVVPRDFHGMGVSSTITSRTRPEKYPELLLMLEELSGALLEAQTRSCDETRRYNRDRLRVACDSAHHAKLILEHAGLPVPVPGGSVYDR